MKVKELSYSEVSAELERYGYEPVIGLEIHIELRTRTKLFCSCPNEFGAEPNTNICPVCMGLPGSLPVLNEQALRYFIRLALALGCDINLRSKFDRKNYFYPDMPKNYQISQYDIPLAVGGGIEIGHLYRSNPVKFIRLKRMHLEEDTGKSLHIGARGIYGADYTLLDYNRAGVPLIEIVTEPVIGSPDEAIEFLELLRLTALYLGISDVKMEEGSMRCDANISLRPIGSHELGVKTEIKNVNSFRFLHRALTYEIARHLKLLKAGEQVVQETRGYDPAKGITFTMRTKEEARDYRYFPEPDLLPVVLNPELIEEERTRLPELPVDRYKRLIGEFKLTPEEAWFLVKDIPMYQFFDASVKMGANPKTAINWLKSEVAGLLNERQLTIDNSKLRPDIYAELCELIDEGQVTSKIAKKILPRMIDEGKGASELIDEMGLKPLSSDEELEKVIREVIMDNPKPVRDYLKGKKGAVGFLIGQVMKRTSGRAHPQRTRTLIERILEAEGEKLLQE